jgi:hypothetical protein
MVKTGAFGALLLAAAVVLSGCATVAVHNYRVYTYECCTSADVNAVYEPGAIIHLHWMAHATTVSAPQRPSSPTITAELLPGSQSATGAKVVGTKAGNAVPISKAKAIHPSITTPGRVVSDIPIPVDAKPGYYTLSFLTTWSPGVTAGGATIIQVK